MRRLLPKTVILQLLSAGAGASISVEALLEVGELFGFKANALRVALARLAQELKVESDERGRYHIHPQFNPTDQWVAQWRLGVKRMKKWQGQWILITLPRPTLSRENRQSLKILTRFGFKEGLPGIWVRPHNLKDSVPQLRHLLYSLGLTRNAEIFLGEAFSAHLNTTWQQQLWDTHTLIKNYRKLLSRLQQSRKNLRRKPLNQALVESFILGGEVIWALARDPLLPAEIFSTDLLQKLTDAMLEYDEIGRSLWSKRLDDFAIKSAPFRLSLVEPSAQRKTS